MGSTVILCTHSVKHLPSADYIIALGAHGTVVEDGSFEELLAMDGYVQSLNIQAAGNQAKEETTALTSAKGENGPSIVVSKAQVDDRTRQLGDFAVYRQYFNALGSQTTIIFLITCLLFGLFSNFSTVWLKWWSDQNTRHPSNQSRRGYYIGIYAFMQLSSLIDIGLNILVNSMVMTKKPGLKFHLRALQTVLTARLSLFTATDLGIIVNRFSQDMTILDSELVYAITNTGLTISQAVVQAAVISTASPYIIVSYPILVGFLYCIQKFYLRTSRQLRFLDLESKSPLYTQFMETYTGLTTIRAFGWAQSSLVKNHALLDTSQRPLYLLSLIQQWLSTVLNLTVALLATVLVALATQLQASSGFTGASLVSLMSFGSYLAGIIRDWTALETSIGAVSRLNAFSRDVRSEELPEETEEPPEDWPPRGAIEIKNVSATYE